VLLALDKLTAGREKAVGELAAQSSSRRCVGLDSVLTTEREREKTPVPGEGERQKGGGGRRSKSG
jgi:hypothetical protein